MRTRVWTKSRFGALLIGCLLSTGSAKAQFIGNCAEATSSAYLDVNNVRALIHNSDKLFYDEQYVVPKDGEPHALFRSSLWIAGKVGNNARATAAITYFTTYWPGPIDDEGLPPSDCTLYDRIYSVKLVDVLEYEATGQAAPDLADWPTGLGAPTNDSEGNLIDLLDEPLATRKDRLIDLEAGERPRLEGHQAIWWVMNDNGNEHVRTDNVPLGIEVHGLAYAVTTPVDAFNNATFYHYRIFNKSSERIDSLYVGLYADGELGYYDDDYVGVDTLRNLALIYNQDNEDLGPHTPGYGTPPPALGIQLLEGPVAILDGLDNDRDGQVDEGGERLGMTTFGSFNDGGGWNETPILPQDYFNYMHGKWRNGRRFSIGRGGADLRSPAIPTQFMYSGDPVTGEYWSLMNTENEGYNSSTTSQGRLFFSSGPIVLESGRSTEFTFGILWAMGTDHLDSITEVRLAADRIRHAFQSQIISEPSANESLFASEELPPLPTLFDNYPNPFRARTLISFELPSASHVRINVYDVLGRRIQTLQDGQMPPGRHQILFDPRRASSGNYFYTLHADSFSETKMMILSR